MVKAIETVYKGYRFRSRLEARWAVFFDAIGLDYQYEPEGFEIPNIGYYLPDFYLPHFGVYCEVKPNLPQRRNELMKAALAVRSDSPINLLLILPDIPTGHDDVPVFWYQCIGYSSFEDYPIARRSAIVLYDDGECDLLLDRYVASKYEEEYFSSKFLDGWGTLHDSEMPYENWDREFDPEIYDFHISEKLARAYGKARQARFEFGETPK